MVQKSFILTVRDLNNKPYKVFCYGYQHTIEYVKYIISEQSKIDRDMITLIMGQTKLLNYKRLEDYSIDESSKINMVITMKTGI